MPGQTAVVFAIVQQALRRHGAVQHAEKVLRRHAMSRFIVDHRHDGRALRDEGTDDHDLGNGVVRAPRVSRQSFSAGQGGEKYDGIAAQLNVVPQRGLVFLGERGDPRVELERFELAEIDGKGFLCHGVSIVSRGGDQSVHRTLPIAARVYSPRGMRRIWAISPRVATSSIKVHSRQPKPHARLCGGAFGQHDPVR